MIFNSLFTQLLLAGLGIALIYVYVQPTLVKISESRDTIELYQTKQQQVNDVNQRLALLVNKINSISPTDQRALLTYMPDKIDVASVSRDIFTISQIAGVSVTDIKYATEDSVLDPKNTDNPVTHTFNVSIGGSYEKVKYFLGLIEQNNYPLEVYEMAASAKPSDSSGGTNIVADLAVEVKLVTYSRI